MSNRTKAAITYGVLSILTIGIAAGVSLGGGDPITSGKQWVVPLMVQLVFLLFAMGYTLGREDQRKGLVREPPPL